MALALSTRPFRMAIHICAVRAQEVHMPTVGLLADCVRHRQGTLSSGRHLGPTQIQRVPLTSSKS